MSRYRVIHCLVWNDDKFPFVSDDCQLIFFHLLTTPLSTPFGCYKASLQALAAEKRWPVECYGEAFQEAFREGFVKHDERHLVIFLPNFLKYNPPASPNVLKSWKKIYDELPECPLKAEFFQQLKAFIEGLHQAFREAFAEVWGHPSPIQEQKQEQKQELTTTTTAWPGVKAPAKPVVYKPAATTTPSAPGYISPKLQTAIRAMQVKAFHCLAEPTETNQAVWVAQLDLLDQHESVSIYACLLDVDAYHASCPDERPRTLKEAMRRMKAALEVAVSKIVQSQNPRERRGPHAKRATG